MTPAATVQPSSTRFSAVPPSVLRERGQMLSRTARQPILR